MNMKSLGLPEHIFYSLRDLFRVWILQKMWFYSFSFDSNSANDEWQLHINLLDRSVHVLLIFQ
jgi:hypothetical protein